MQAERVGAIDLEIEHGASYGSSIARTRTNSEEGASKESPAVGSPASSDEALQAIIAEARRRTRRRRIAIAIGVILIACIAAGGIALFGGQSEVEAPESSPSGAATTSAGSCDVGGAPTYFVPGGPGITVGCAELGISGRTVPISAHASRIDGESQDAYTCLNPAYRGRGNPGMYIPAVCADSVDEARVLGLRVPRQGVRRFERVVWGIAPSGLERAVVSSDDAGHSAAIFEVDRDLIARAGLGSPAFAIFMAELPANSACRGVAFTFADGRESRTDCSRG